VFELYRWCDGQDASMAQFLDAGRLLTLSEVVQATLDCHSRQETAAAFAELATSGSGDAGPSRGVGSPPQVLLPITEEFRGRKRIGVDWQGRVWLCSGFNTLLLAPSLSAYIPQILT
jgi:hypothetical protein